MNATDAERQLNAEVAQIKRAAIQRRTRTKWAIVILFVLGGVVAALLWFLQAPADRDENHFALSLGLGGAVFCIGALLFRLVYPIPHAFCPQCGCDWNVESENNLQTWLGWKKCPNCGLNMTNRGA